MTMHKTCYIHIGYNKSASTTIQEGLKNNARKLARAGWYVPKTGIRGEVVAHHNIQFEISGHPFFLKSAGGISDLYDELEGKSQPNVILSTEYFCEQNEKLITKTKQIFDRIGEAKIIAYVRRQDVWFESLWRQGIKTGWINDEFKDFYEKQKKPKGHYYRDISNWASIFGKENVFVRVLEKSQLKSNVFHDFLSYCEVPNPEGYSIPESMNVSPSIKTIQVIRHYLLKYGTFQQDYEKLGGKVAQGLLMYANKHGWNEMSETVLSAEMSEEIMAHYRDENNQLAQEFLNQPELFVDPPKKFTAGSFNILDLPKEELVEITDFLIKFIFLKK